MIKRIFCYSIIILIFLGWLSVWNSDMPCKSIFLSDKSESWKSMEFLRQAILDYAKNNAQRFPSKNWFDKDFRPYVKKCPVFMPYDGYVSALQNGGANKIVAYIEKDSKICILYNAGMRSFVQEMPKKDFYLTYLKKILNESKMLGLSKDDILNFYGLSKLHYSLLFEWSYNNIIYSDCLNKSDCNGFTPLMYAVILGKKDIVKKMLSLGIPVGDSNFLNDNVMELAFIVNREIYNILLQPQK